MSAFLTMRPNPYMVSYEEAARDVLGDAADEHLSALAAILSSQPSTSVSASAYLRCRARRAAAPLPSSAFGDRYSEDRWSAAQSPRSPRHACGPPAAYAHGVIKRRRSPRWVDGSPRCSFCGKPKAEVEMLIGGPGVCICDECVGLCNRIIGKGRTPSR